MLIGTCSPATRRATGRGGPSWSPAAGNASAAPLGSPGCGVHDLRHYVATELLTAGIDARTVAHRLGHARTSTTLDRYWAWVPAGDRDAAKYLERLLK